MGVRHVLPIGTRQISTCFDVDKPTSVTRQKDAHTQEMLHRAAKRAAHMQGEWHLGEPIGKHVRQGSDTQGGQWESTYGRGWYIGQPIGKHIRKGMTAGL